jgi:hypothetical protein
LDEFKPYLESRLQAGVWNAHVLLRELRQQGYQGGYTLLKDWLQPQRASAVATAVRRFETPPGKQAQVDWGHLGYLEAGDEESRVWLYHHAGLQPASVGASGIRSEVGNAAADA